jgi:hypothetical protein
LNAFLVSFGVIFVAELGDKSQLMALAFATRYKPLPVLVAITLATAIVHLASVGIGAVVGAALPTRPMRWQSSSGELSARAFPSVRSGSVRRLRSSSSQSCWASKRCAADQPFQRDWPKR